MSIKVEKTEKNNELKLTFTIEAAKFDEGMKKVYAKTAKYFNVPGFRRGKAPMNIIERRIAYFFCESLKFNNLKYK